MTLRPRWIRLLGFVLAAILCASFAGLASLPGHRSALSAANGPAHQRVYGYDEPDKTASDIARLASPKLRPIPRSSASSASFAATTTTEASQSRADSALATKRAGKLDHLPLGPARPPRLLKPDGMTTNQWGNARAWSRFAFRQELPSTRAKLRPRSVVAAAVTRCTYLASTRSGSNLDVSESRFPRGRVL